MRSRIKISKHKHTGHLRPHEHTSYMPLFVMVFIVGLMLVGFSVTTFVEASPPPQAESVSLTGTVPKAPPKEGATIDVPSDQKHFTTSPITVSGTCPASTLVEIYKNDIFAGSAPCETNGTYSVQIDLLYGKNVLTAQVFDVLNQAGPTSKPVTIFYDATPPPAASLSALNFLGTQLLIHTEAVYRGTFPGQTLNVPISLLGGIGPYAVSIDWGDGGKSIIPRSDNSIFNAPHIFKKAGTYKITIEVTDSSGQVAFMTVAAIVNGQPAVIAGTNTSANAKTSLSKLIVLWPLFAILVTMVVSFWLGEKREKKVMQKHGNPALQVPVGTTPHLSI